MTKMNKSFLFYLRNWDVMEQYNPEYEDEDEDEENLEKFFNSSGLNDARDKFSIVCENAHNYARSFLNKIKESVKCKHLDLITIETHNVNNTNKYWDRYVFIDKTLEDIKTKKWCLGFYIRKYRNKIGVLSYICRYRGPTKTLKTELDKIFGDIINYHDGEDLYDNVTHLFFHELPTNYNSEFNDEEIIEEIVEKTKNSLTKKKLDSLFKIN